MSFVLFYLIVPFHIFFIFEFFALLPLACLCQNNTKKNLNKPNTKETNIDCVMCTSLWKTNFAQYSVCIRLQHPKVI